MSTLHQRLVARCDEEDIGDNVANALRAVVELHGPASDEPSLCRTCWDEAAEDYCAYPCSTIRAIAEALGVSVEGDQP